MNPTHPGAATWKRHPPQASEHQGPASSTQPSQSSYMCLPHCGSASKIRTKILLYPGLPASSLVFSSEEAINTCRIEKQSPSIWNEALFLSPLFSTHTRHISEYKNPNQLKSHFFLKAISTLASCYHPRQKGFF